jgi:hypothetical protein
VTLHHLDSLDGSAHLPADTPLANDLSHAVLNLKRLSAGLRRSLEGRKRKRPAGFPGFSQRLSQRFKLGMHEVSLG